MFTLAMRRKAMSLFKRRLGSLRSPLTASVEATDQLLRQADSVLDDVEIAMASADLTGAVRQDLRLAAEIGASRAVHRVSPVESLRAATAMFEVLLPIVFDELQAQGESQQALMSAATTLHESIMHRVGLGAVSYATFLLKKVDSSHRDERHRIARELHDRAAHAVGVALQDLELHDVYVDQKPANARMRIGSARTALHEALNNIRQLAQELRESAVEVGGLKNALTDYVTSRIPTDIRTTLVVTDAEDLPDEVCEELYVVVREAIRNSVVHAQARHLEVIVTVDDGDIHAVVRDDGRGFDVAKAMASPTGIGLSSMRERLELLAGTLDVRSVPGEGTTISISIAQQGPGT
jgi:signal transduction histidine kinase